MRIDETIQQSSEIYTDEMRHNVENTFIHISHISEFEMLLQKIRAESNNLREVFITKVVQKAIKEDIAFFDSRMQAMTFFTLKNLENYQQHGWQELIYGGDINDGDTSNTENQP